MIALLLTAGLLAQAGEAPAPSVRVGDDAPRRPVIIYVSPKKQAKKAVERVKQAPKRQKQEVVAEVAREIVEALPAPPAYDFEASIRRALERSAGQKNAVGAAIVAEIIEKQREAQAKRRKKQEEAVMALLFA